MKQVGLITLVISIIHFFEDVFILALGRYTEINFFILAVIVICVSFIIGITSRLKSVKKFLGQ